MSVRLRPITFTGLGFSSQSTKVATSGSFSVGMLAAEEYAIEVDGVPSAGYVKDIRHGSRSVLRAPLRPGGGQDLRVILARDGGRVAAHVADSDGNGVADANVVVMPSDTATEAALADEIVTGRTDFAGAWSSGMLAPGKCRLVAMYAPVDKSPECIGKLLRAKRDAPEVEVGTGAPAIARVELSGRQ
jgi:hypothetical protein